jgi:NAD(P)-dependent dehydrogenase (short-subunit alcohol dehydrogenase family)
VEEVSADWDGLEALVNNAATQIIKPLLQTTVQEWDQAMATNLRAAYLTAKEAHALLARAGGAIVNIGSVHALATSVNVANYAASKGGLVALTRAQALEFASDSIRVNSVLPGAIDTEMLRQGLDRDESTPDDPEEKLKALAANTPLGRVGLPSEIARVILFLADNDQSSFITGQSIIADGGALARLSTE